MRLIIEDGGKTSGAEGTLTADRAVNGSMSARSWTNRPHLATVARAIEGAAADVREALLQVMNGVPPYVPRIRVRETNEAIVVTARMPDVDEDSVEVHLTEHALHVHGEKSEQRERTRRAYRSIYKVYRTFERTIPIDCDVDRENVAATLREGVLRIHLPREQTSLEEPESALFRAEGVGVD